MLKGDNDNKQHMGVVFQQHDACVIYLRNRQILCDISDLVPTDCGLLLTLQDRIRHLHTLNKGVHFTLNHYN